MNEKQTMYVVICDQSYANFKAVQGVYSTREKAEEAAKSGFDNIIEEFILDE